jgi:hypothetical protein
MIKTEGEGGERGVRDCKRKEVRTEEQGRLQMQRHGKFKNIS